MNYRNRFLGYSLLAGFLVFAPIGFLMYKIIPLFLYGAFVLICFLVGCIFDYISHKNNNPTSISEGSTYSYSMERAWIFIKKGGMWGLMVGIWINFFGWFLCFAFGNGCNESMALYILLFLLPVSLIGGISIGLMCLNRITKIICISLVSLLTCYLLGFLLYSIFS